MVIKDLIKKKLFLVSNILILLIFLWVFYINKLPIGYIVSGTDHAWFFDFNSAFKTFFYTWTNSLGYGEGRPYELQAAIPFFIVQGVLFNLGLPANIIQSLMLLIFIYVSFLSFYFSLKIFGLTKERENLSLWFSVIYSLNGYTLFLFMHVFGYFYQQILYIFIPLFISMAYRLITSKVSKKDYISFFFMSLCGSMGFNNPGFFVALNSIYVFMLLFLLLIEEKTKYLEKIKRYIFLICTLLLSNAYWITPYLFVLFDRASSLVSANPIWDLGSWIKWQSTHIIDVIRFIPISDQDKFPINSNLNDFWIAIFKIFSFIPITYLLLAMWLNKKNNLLIIFTSIYITLVLFISKSAGPLSELSIVIFTSPIINSLRSFDKLFVFLPFITLFVIYLGLIQNNTIKLSLKIIIIVSLVIYPLPFYIGKLQRNISTAFEPGKTYLTADYSNLVKVPDDYFKVASYVNSLGDLLFKVQYLPFGVIASPGWSQYPKWKFRGNDVTTTLFDKPIQRPSNYLDGQRYNYGLLFNTYPEPAWIIRMMALMNDKILVFNRDVDARFLTTTVEKISSLVSSGLITKIYSGEYLDMYTLSEKTFLPQFYTPKDIIYSEDLSDSNFPQILSLNMFDTRALYLGSSSKELIIKSITEEKEKGSINLNSVKFFNFNDVTNSLEIANGSKIFTTPIPARYRINFSDNQIELIKENFDDITRINSKELVSNLDNYITIPVSSFETLINEKYINSSTTSSYIELNKQVNSLNIKDDFNYENENLVVDPSFEKNLGNGVNFCGGGKYDEAINIDGRASTDATDGKRSFELSSKNGTACTMLKINDGKKVEPNTYYKVSFDYKTVSGNTASFAVWQIGENISLPDEIITTKDSEWHHFQTIFKTGNDTNDLRIFFYARANTGLIITNRYDNISLEKVASLRSRDVDVKQVDNFNEIDTGSSTKLNLEYQTPSEENLIVNPELLTGISVFSCGAGNPEKTLAVSGTTTADKLTDHTIATLSSSNGNACTILRVQPSNILSNEILKLSLEYKPDQNGLAAFQLWQMGSEIGFPSENFKDSDGEWHKYETYFKPADGARELRLFLYANSNGDGLVTNSYRNIKLSRVAIVPGTIVSLNKKSTIFIPPNEIEYKKINPTKYIVQIKHSSGSFPIIFSESFDKNWKIYAKKTDIDNNETSKFISKNIEGSIQNNNIDPGWIWETFLPSKKIFELKNAHYLANGYSNAYFINQDIICKKITCITNDDQTFDYTLIVEYWPQRWFYVGLIISGTTLLSCLGYLGYDFARRRRKSKVKELKLVNPYAKYDK